MIEKTAHAGFGRYLDLLRKCDLLDLFVARKNEADWYQRAAVAR
jgi:hypothetical protein